MRIIIILRSFLMKKILSLSLTLIMLAMLFSGCGVFGTKGLSAGEFYANYTEEPAWLYQTATNINELFEKTSANTIGSSSALAAFADAGETRTDITVYSLEKNQNVHTFTINNEDIYTIEFMNIFGNAFFTVIHGVKRTDDYDFSTTLYNKNGEQIARAKGIHAYSSSSLGSSFSLDFGITYEANLIRFDKTIFKVSAEGTATILKEKNNFMLDLPDVDFYNGTYYITETDASFVVYDTNLEFVSNWKYKFANHDGIDYDYFILSDGTILFQSFEVLPEDAKDYDYCEDGEKIKVETVLIDPKKGTEKSANASFIIFEQTALDEIYSNGETTRDYSGVADKYKNIACISYIEDKKLTTEVVVAIDNNGKITGELFRDLPMIDDYSIVEIFSDGIFYYPTINDTYIFINENNEKLLEISSSALYNMDTNANYIVLDGVIYDYSFRVVYDFGAENYELYSDGWYTEGVMSDGILLTRDDAVYLYKNGATNLIISKDSTDEIWSVYNDYYVIRREDKNGDYKYVYFNARGQELFTSFEYSASRIVYNNDLGVALFRTYNPDGKTTYYRVSK